MSPGSNFDPTSIGDSGGWTIVLKPTLVLGNATVLTLDPSLPRAEAVAIAGDRILAVGDHSLASSLAGPDTKVVDCAGSTVVPGFQDAHCHVLAFARSLGAVDCSPAAVRSIKDIKARIRERAAAVPPGTWITCNGYNEFHLEGRLPPTLRDLDDAAPRHPVKLNHFSGHVCVLNTLGLRAAGITAGTPEPPGAVIERDEHGEPNGILFEMNEMVDRAIPPPSGAELDRMVGQADRVYLSSGITSLQDATASNDADRWETFGLLKQSGALTPRLTMMVGAASWDKLLPERTAVTSPGLRPGPVKIMVTQSTGSISPSSEELADLALRIHRSGRQMAIHAIEETSIEAAIDAIERAVAQAPKRDHRHRIEHCSECPDRLIKRIKATGAAIVTQPPFVYFSGDRYLDTVARDRQELLYRIGSFVRAGILTGGSSDSPVVPLDPLAGIYAAVTRRTPLGRSVGPAEALAPRQALSLYTRDAARCSFLERESGTIAAGSLADLVVLSGDPITIGAERIREIRVEKTVLGGRVVWEA